MAEPQLWQFVVLIFASIVSSKCCMLSRGMECPLRRASFGGRLVFRGNKAVGSGLLPGLANRGRVLIFQTPPAHLRSHMGFGRGQIWIGRRTCQGSNSQLPGQCPWTAGDRPCLDTKLPCDTEFVSEAPSYAQSNPLEFPEVSENSIQNVTTPCRELEDVDLQVETMPMPGLEKSRFNISWRLPNLAGNCDISHQQITLHRLDVANCFVTTRTKPRDYVLQTGTRSAIFDRLRPYSLYNVTYLARNPAGTYVTSQLERTAETKPIEAPRNLTYRYKANHRNKVVLSWIVPRCGFRNGEINGYNRTIIRNGRTPCHRIMRGYRQTIDRVFSGVEWVFRVQACTTAGCGPSAEASGVRP